MTRRRFTPSAMGAHRDAGETDTAEHDLLADVEVRPSAVHGWRRFLPWFVGFTVLSALILVVSH